MTQKITDVQIKLKDRCSIKTSVPSHLWVQHWQCLWFPLLCTPFNRLRPFGCLPPTWTSGGQETWASFSGSSGILAFRMEASCVFKRHSSKQQDPLWVNLTNLPMLGEGDISSTGLLNTGSSSSDCSAMKVLMTTLGLVGMLMVLANMALRWPDWEPVAELLPLEEIVAGMLITQKLVFGSLFCKSVQQLMGFMSLYRGCNFVLTNLSL